MKLKAGSGLPWQDPVLPGGLTDRPSQSRRPQDRVRAYNAETRRMVIYA